MNGQATDVTGFGVLGTLAGAGVYYPAALFAALLFHLRRKQCQQSQFNCFVKL